MRKILAYCLLALLTLLSCTRVPDPYAETGHTVDIRISTAGLKETKATPGDGQGGDGGGFPDYYMSFNAPAGGTLKVWAASADGANHDDFKVGVLVDGAVISSQKGGYTGSTEIDYSGLEEGSVLIYPVGGALRFYKIQFEYSDSTFTWDFNNADFKAKLARVPNSLDTPSSWTVSIDGLTIWSKGNSTWNSGGYFEWGDYYTDPDLVILIANATEIVGKYPTAGTLQQKTLTDAVVQFSGIPAGNYTVYAFGNTGGLWAMEGQGAQTAKDYLLSLTTMSQVENLKFTAKPNYMQYYSKLSDLDNDVAGEGKIDPTHPWDDGEEINKYGLPVSAKATLQVSEGLQNGEAYLELLRCVAKVTAVIVNNTGESMTLYDYRHVVKKINRTTGWVIPHEDDDVQGAVGHLAAYPNKKYNREEPIPITEKGSREYDWYVFPSEGPYTIDIGFTLHKGESNQHEYSYKDLPVTNWKAENIPALGRNQHLTVTTRISKGLTVSFNFKVEAWDTNSATVEFD